MARLLGSIGLGEAPALLLLAVGIVLPVFGFDEYTVHLLSMIAIGAILALGLQLLLGHSGQLSIGQAAFYGIGGYTSGLLATGIHAPFVVGFFAAALAAGLASLLMVPITRLRGAYLAVATFGFTIIVYLIFKNEDWLTGGAFGVMNIPRPRIGPIDLGGSVASFYLTLTILAVCMIAMWRLHHSRFGRALNAIRQDEQAAAASGIEVMRYKSQAFIIAALLSGFAGSLYAHLTGYLSPNDFGFLKSMDILIMVVIGGLRRLEGAILGAAVVVLFPEYLRVLDDYRLLIFGCLIVVMTFVGNDGLSGLARRALKLALPQVSARIGATYIDAQGSNVR